MTLKIGFVTGEYPPMEGGVGAFTRELARALAAAGHEIHIITSREARPAGAPRTLSFRPDPLPIDVGYLHPIGRRWIWREVGLIADLTLRYDLDVVNVQYQAAAFNMRVPSINLLPWRLRGLAHSVVTFHDLRVPYLFPKAGRLREGVVRQMARRADGVIVTNRDDYATLAPLLDDRVAQIPIGSNVAVHPAGPAALAAARDRLGLPGDACLLGYFGFLNPSKGADTLLQALAGLPAQVHLVFIGGQTGASDPATNHAFLDGLRAQIVDLGLAERVHWTGFVPDGEVSAYLAAADLLVMPYRDGVSLRRGTLMAVLAHGRPLVTTEPAGARDGTLRHGEHAHLVPREDPDALRLAIAGLLADPVRRAALGQGAQALADAFTWDKIAARTADFYRALMAH